MKINVLGSGHMGKQICSLFVVLGHKVKIWQNSAENDEKTIKNEITKIEKHFATKSKGDFSIVKNIKDIENNLTIETVKEDLNIKKEVISKLNFKDNIFSNTSSLKLSQIGDNINGLHFMNPVTIPLIELCKKKDYSEDLLDQLVTSINKLSYDIIEVKDNSGFLVNRVLFREISYFFYLYEFEKVSVKDLKKINKILIKNSDPIKIVNMIGLDTCLSILENLNKEDKSFYVPELLRDSVKNNILGFKNKKLLKI